jgi:hypothetical protein
VGKTTVASATEEAVNRQKRARSIDMRAPTQKKKKEAEKGQDSHTTHHIDREAAVG